MKTIRTYLYMLMLAMLPAVASAQSHDFELIKNLDIMHTAVRELDIHFVDTIDPGKVMETGINAMMQSLDPYTVYYPESDMDELKTMTTGKYAGIGAIIRTYTGRDYVSIEEPYENMPAAEAGLKAGDEILAIGGESMKGRANSYVSDHLRGEPDTKVSVTVRRPGVEDSLTFVLTRRIIALPSVPYYGMHCGYGYIFLDSFTENCSRDVMAAAIELKEQGAKGLILDLRGNGGGLMQEAINIVGLFVPKGTKVLETRGKLPQSVKSYQTARNPIDENIPLVVMVDDESASASEIVSGALQDLDRAVIVGTRTFGKGLVQSTRPLPYNGTLKLTTAKYYIPSGRCIQEIDYSKRGDNGQAQHIPDSLTLVFQTAAGRPVRDGGGIRPDVPVKQDTMPDIVYNLSMDVVLFDYVNKYCIEHETIAPVDDFVFTDDDYLQFRNFVENSDFQYVSQSSKALKSVRQIAQLEGLSDKAREEFDALAAKLQYDLKSDLDIFRDDVKKIVAMAIVTRYYYQRGTIAQSLKTDRFLRESVSVLDDPSRYASILKP